MLFFLLPFLWSNSYKVQNVESRQLSRIVVSWYYHRQYLTSLLRIIRRYEFNIIHQPPPTGSAPNKLPLPTCSVIYLNAQG